MHNPARWPTTDGVIPYRWLWITVALVTRLHARELLEALYTARLAQAEGSAYQAGFEALERLAEG